jgi:hypothetical protein
MTVKCFWCGSINEKHADFCTTCNRKMQWSNFFKAVLRPTMGCLMGEEHSEVDEQLATVKTPVVAA